MYCAQKTIKLSQLLVIVTCYPILAGISNVKLVLLLCTDCLENIPAENQDQNGVPPNSVSGFCTSTATSSTSTCIDASDTTASAALPTNSSMYTKVGFASFI